MGAAEVVPRSIAMKITGHKTETVYRRYAIVNEADVAEGARAAGGLSRGRGRGEVVGRAAPNR